MEPVPKIGDKHHFFDDGKMRESRHYIAEVLSVITPEEAKQTNIARTEYYQNEPYTFTQSLYERWVEEVNDHRQGERPWVLVDSEHFKPHAPWLYEETTDYFIECSIPQYDADSVWFVRTIRGGWFSIDTTHSWMGGQLMPIDYKWINNE
jgi:hypothetical protein